MNIEYELLGRLVLSCVLGAVIGYERRTRHKAAGLRTNVMVCLGSCLIMLLSQELYLQVEGRTNADPARLAAQVVSGIGFLGAGAIMKEGLTVIGLTTAACLWVVAGVGLAVGAGFYSGAIFTTLLIVLALMLFGQMERLLMKNLHLELFVRMDNTPGVLTKICRTLDTFGITVNLITDLPTAQEGIRSVKLHVYNPQGARKPLILDSLLAIEGVAEVHFQE